MYEPDLLKTRLKTARDYRNYSQQGIATSLGVHVTAYNKWERGKNKINAADLAKVANSLRMSLEYFFTKRPARECDLDLRLEESALKAMAREIENLQKLLRARDTSADEVLQAVAENVILHKLVSRLRHLEERRLMRVYDKIDGFLDGIEEAQHEATAEAAAAVVEERDVSGTPTDSPSTRDDGSIEKEAEVANG